MNIEAYNLKINDIKVSVANPRKVFNKESLEELAGTIKTHGIIQPLSVRLIKGETDKYEIIDGERRYRAAIIANLAEIPCVVDSTSTDDDAEEMRLIANLQREDLTPIDEALGFKAYAERHRKANPKITDEEIAKRLGKSRTRFSQIAKLAELPEEIHIYFREPNGIFLLEQTHGEVLFRYFKDDNASITKYATIAYNEQLKRRELEERIKAELEPEKVKPKHNFAKDAEAFCRTQC